MTYKDPGKPAKERAEHLLGLMTLEEKAAQLVQPFGWQAYEHTDGEITLTEDFKRRVAEAGVGSLYGMLRADPWTGVTLASGLSPRQGAEAVNAIQRYAIGNSRLGIPILIGEECSHGHMAIGATVFPVPLSLGSSWNVDLYREMCRAVALETRSQGGTVTYSPVLDVVRDPRWGRTEECFGEDAYLISELAVASVEGLQGESLSSRESVGATLKHFVGYGSSEGGRNAGPVHMGWRELLEVDLLPFKKAVGAGAVSIMPAYNEIDGVPCTANTALMEDILRGAWGFEGLVITDCGAIEMLAAGHDVAEDGLDASVQAITAGIDMEMSGAMFGEHLVNAVHTGKLAVEVLDRAVQRVLELKFKLGLFEQPYADPEAAEKFIGSSRHRELARKLAAESIILLKNEGGTLPLNAGAGGNSGRTGNEGTGAGSAGISGTGSRDACVGPGGKDSGGSGKVAVIGPNADAPYNQLGDYTSPQQRSSIVTVLDGIRGKLGPERVLYAPGCRIKGDDREGFEAALACAVQADTVVLALGGSSARDFGEGTIDLKTGASQVTEHSWSDMDCGEGIDRISLALSGVQLELFKELHKLGKPLIVVYINGRPVSEPWIEEHADAILEAWYPGQEGGHAVADILFGDVNPSGRLTISWPKDAGQLPVYYNGKRSRGKRYLEADSQPRYPFGFGLGYTSFSYADLIVEPQAIAAGETATVSITVTNTGEREGAEVVQLYISDVASKVSRPAKELKGFRKITLSPGEAQTVEFEVGAEQLQYIGPDYRPVVEPGAFKVLVGSHVNDVREAALEVKEGAHGTD
ncbi:glycoside hydrolase family 3 N-terminal domain-containing protein [Paenibacillus sp. S150]|uniref:glycoside hydrolase family 3 N-terminal domain-containing protein n=1 Tax=Paenibacillus sp. S150 TaxID=2749826 RepID=UPI001C59DC6C|nr:glycoside hydrolase family 3 N-terminal domain-containing protein [Paenibacillus sp. S150]MBW4082063.1 glycoside hydrolase family 3 C-terminal domain-containing protein [Paenibacillus sp. S150]